MKYLKWLLLLPVAAFPFACLRPNPSPGPSDSPISGHLWMGLILGCALLVLLTRNGWSTAELTVATLVARACQFALLPNLLLSPQNFYYLFLFGITNPAYYILTLPSCIVGLSAILRCAKTGVLTTRQVVLHIVLQFIPCVDLVNAIWVFALNSDYVPKGSRDVTPKDGQPAPASRSAAAGLLLVPNQPKRAVSIMREVAARNREEGQWGPDQWLVLDKLFADGVGLESFYVGTVDGKDACAFIFQWSDRKYWPDTPKYEAGYLQRFCVRREFADMTAQVIEAVKAKCVRCGARYLCLAAGCDEPTARDVYLAAGFEIVRTLERNGGSALLLYEMKL